MRNVGKAVGKLGAMRAAVPTEREVALPVSPPASTSVRPTELTEFGGTRRQAAALLDREAGDIAERWEAQVRTLLPEATGDATGSSRASRAVAVVHSLAASVASDGGVADDAVALGFAFGTAAFAAGGALHHLLRALDLLVAMCLFVVEDATARGVISAAGAADGLRLGRRVQQAAGPITLAAVRGYTQAGAVAMQERFRRLRHDLRNPLSTIRSALELMADESVPEEARRSPRFRAMIERNAMTLDQMIVSRLGDAEARSGVGAYQRVAARSVACAVRRDLRADADTRDVSVVVQGGEGPVRVDAAGLELLLHNALLAALHEASPGEVLTIGFPASDGTRLALLLASSAPNAPIANDRSRAELTSLATTLGAWLDFTPGGVFLAFPAISDAPRAPNTSSGGERESRDDVGGARQREDGQTGAL